MNKFINQIKSDRFKNLDTFLVLFAIGQGFLFVLGGKELFPTGSIIFATIVRTSVLLMFFLFGCAGFVGMVRKEAHQVILIKGKPAQVAGFIFWIISWVIAVYVLFTIVESLFSFKL